MVDSAVQNQPYELGVPIYNTTIDFDIDAATRAQQRPGAHALFAASESPDYTMGMTGISSQDRTMDRNVNGRVMAREQVWHSGSQVGSAGGAQGAPVPVPVRTEVRVEADGTISLGSIEELRRAALMRGMEARVADETLRLWVERKQREVLERRMAVGMSMPVGGMVMV